MKHLFWLMAFTRTNLLEAMSAATAIAVRISLVWRVTWGLCVVLAGATFAMEAEQEKGHVIAHTMSEVNQVLQDVAIEVVLQSEGATYNTADLVKAQYLIPLATFIDLNVIGSGQPVRLDRAKMVNFIVSTLQAGQDLKHVSAALIDEFTQGRFEPVREVEKPTTETASYKLSTRVGGFGVTEFEYHQEPNGEYVPLMEINQVRIYFSAQLSSATAPSHVSFLAEWNPVPEEVIHQIEEAPLHSVGLDDTLRAPTPEVEDVIEFEQLYIKIGDLGGSGIDFTVGQIRNPFGIWSDYTSHRNFSSTKNNTLVNGFALKKIELGVQVEKHFSGGLGLTAAIVHGRLGRTSNLPRADNDKAKDFVGRITYGKGKFAIGASAYLAEFSFNKRVAYGLEWQVLTPRLSFSGEAVYQKNSQRALRNAQRTIQVSSLGIYAQFNYLLTERLSLYGLYETWSLYAEGEIVDKPTYKVFHGLKYQVNRHTRWTPFEFGWMFHQNFDKGNLHLSTQLEITY